MAIQTSEVAFQAERGCYIGINVEGVVAPASGTKTAPFIWGAGLVPVAPAALGWCVAGGTFAGNFSNIGFQATGKVMYQYGVNATTVAAPGLYTEATSCAVANAGTGATGAVGNNNFVAMARTNLDGNTAAPNTGISVWDSTVNHGANDCQVGQF